jgi:hypothetical protein
MEYHSNITEKKVMNMIAGGGFLFFVLMMTFTLSDPSKYKQQVEYMELREEICNMKITELQREINELTKNKTELITVRKLFTTLEQNIMIDITGSRRTSALFTNILQLLSARYNIQFNSYFTKYSLTEDHIFLMMEIKKYGNNVIISPTINLKELELKIISILEVPNNTKDNQMIKDILKLFEVYNLLK